MTRDELKSPFKVYDGTRDSQTSLCLSCRAALTIRGARFGDDVTFCRGVNNNGHAYPVRFVVTSCSGYDDKTQPSRWDLEQIAWELTTSPSRKLGFLSPQERAARANTPATTIRPLALRARPERP